MPQRPLLPLTLPPVTSTLVPWPPACTPRSPPPISTHPGPDPRPDGYCSELTKRMTMAAMAMKIGTALMP